MPYSLSPQAAEGSDPQGNKLPSPQGPSARSSNEVVSLRPFRLTMAGYVDKNRTKSAEEVRYAT